MDLSSATWRKTSQSSDAGDQCVEIASIPGTVAIRDSKDPQGPQLLVDPCDFRRFASVIKGL